MDRAALCQLAKRRLNITWSDPETDGRMEDTLQDALPPLADMVGLGYDCAAGEWMEYDLSIFNLDRPSRERSLLVIYISYLWEHQGHLFWANYQEEIAACRQARAVARAQWEEATADESAGTVL